jgi:hypothetical protein
MKRLPLVIAAPLVSAVLVLSACGGAVSDEHVIEQPASVEEVEEGEVARVTLTESAAERLDIQTVAVEPSDAGTNEELVVPSAAVYLTAEGAFWVYTNPEPLVFVRHEISIVREHGDLAFLSDGPPAGTEVVTVGVPELYGTETGNGADD